MNVTKGTHNGKNIIMYQKLTEHFKVYPLVFDYEPVQICGSFFSRNRFSAVISILLGGKFTKNNLNIIQYLLNHTCKYGYIFIDTNELPQTNTISLAHEFVHSKQNKNGTMMRDFHDIRELEADILSTEFLLKNNIDVIGCLKQLISQTDNIPFLKTIISELTPVFRLIIFMIILSDMVQFLASFLGGYS